MAISTRPPRAPQSHPGPHWLRRPVLHARGWTGALIRLDGQVYAAESFFVADDDTGAVFQILDLHGRGRTHYRLTLGQGQDTYDGPPATYRAAVTALDELEALERTEWRADVTVAPF